MPYISPFTTSQQPTQAPASSGGYVSPFAKTQTGQSPFNNLNQTLNAQAQKATLASVPTPAKGFNIGQNISNLISGAEKGVQSLFQPAITPVALPNGVKLSLTPPTKTAPVTQLQSAGVPMIPNLQQGQTKLTPDQMLKIQPPSIPPKPTNSMVDTIVQQLIAEPTATFAKGTLATAKAWANIVTGQKLTTQEEADAEAASEMFFGGASLDAAGGIPKGVGTQITNKLTKNVTESPGIPQSYFISTKDLLTLGNKTSNAILDSLNLDKGELTAIRKAGLGKAGVNIEVPSSTIIQMTDKPWFGKVKAFFGKEPTDLTAVIQAKPQVKSIAGLLGDGEHTPQEVTSAVINNGLDKTPEGKQVLQQVVEAQKKGMNIQIETPQGVYKNSPQITSDFHAALEGASNAHEGALITNEFTDNAITKGTDLKATRSVLAKELNSFAKTGNYKRDYAYIQQLKGDTQEGEYITALDTNITKIDLAIAKATQSKEDAIVNPIVDEISGILQTHEGNQSVQDTQNNPVQTANNQSAQSASGKAPQVAERPQNQPAGTSENNQALNPSGGQGSNNRGESSSTLSSGSKPTEPASTSSNSIGNGQGLKVSKIAKEIEAKAVESKLTDSFSQLAGYNPQTVKEQAKLNADLLNSGIDNVRSIIRGEKELPKEINPAYFIKTVEDYLVKNPSGEIASELARSPIISSTSEAAQILRMAGERDPYAPLSLIRQLEDSRKAVYEKKGSTIPKEVKKITASIKKQFPKKNEWDSFIQEITCGN